MTVAEISTLLTAIGAVATALFLPIYVNHRTAKSKQAELEQTAKSKQSDQDTVSLQGLAKALQHERDLAVARLDKMSDDYQRELARSEAQHRADLARVSAEWQSQLNQAHAQIEALKTQVASLYQQLYRPLP